MSSFKIKFRVLLPMTSDEPVENGELWVEKGLIKEIRPVQTDAPNIPALDLSDHLVLPGFVNAHSHLFLSVLSGQLNALDRFTDWIRNLRTLNGQVTPEQREQGILRGAREMLESGVTTVGDYLPEPETLAVFPKLPLRQVLFLETLGFRSDHAEAIAGRVESALRDPPNPDDKVALGIAPHAPYSVSPDLFKNLKNLSERYAAPMSSHIAEFPEEVRFLKDGGGEMGDFLIERGVNDAKWAPPGVSPVRYMDSLGVLENLACAHLNFIEGDVDLLPNRHASAVFCPKSTRWFGRDKFMPVRELLDRGVPVGLGTDSLASNDALNFLEELRAADEMLPDVSRPEILRMATQGGAKALGLDTGTLEPGRPADLIGFRIETTPSTWSDIPFDPARKQADFSMIDGVGWGDAGTPTK